MGLCALALTLAAAPAAEAGSSPRAGKSIVGGGAASISDWPFQAAILRKGRLHCGGAVIAPTKILTAAHCVFRFNPARMTVVTGRARLSDDSVGEADAVASAVVHPDYRRSFRHDVAVITLRTPTEAPRIELPSAEQAALATAPGTLLRVAGFGARHPLGGKLSALLRQAAERVRANRRCRGAFGWQYSGRAMICALGRRLARFDPANIHATACSGDSGGPLVADPESGPAVVGIVSFGGRVCGFAGAPTVYSRVSDAMDFIQLQME